MKTKGKRLLDAEQYEVLAAVYAKTGTEVQNGAVGAYRTKTIRAGDCLYINCYPLIGAETWREQRERLADLERDEARAVAAKYARYNNARRTRLFEMLVEANIFPEDLHLSMTYEYDNSMTMDYGRQRYRTREEARRDVRNWLGRVKRLLKRHGCDMKEFRWILVTVTKESSAEGWETRSPKHHHHMLIHGIPLELRSEVERMWGLGYCNADRIQRGDKSLGALSGYVARQEGSANGDHARGERSYTTSRNIIKPEVKTSDARISRRRVAQIAADVRANAGEIFGRIYPEYRLAEEPKIMISDFTAGAYIWAKLIKKPNGTRGDGARKGGRICGNGS